MGGAGGDAIDLHHPRHMLPLGAIRVMTGPSGRDMSRVSFGNLTAPVCPRQQQRETCDRTDGLLQCHGYRMGRHCAHAGPAHCYDRCEPADLLCHARTGPLPCRQCILPGPRQHIFASPSPLHPVSPTALLSIIAHPRNICRQHSAFVLDTVVYFARREYTTIDTNRHTNRHQSAPPPNPHRDEPNGMRVLCRLRCYPRLRQGALRVRPAGHLRAELGHRPEQLPLPAGACRAPHADLKLQSQREPELRERAQRYERRAHRGPAHAGLVGNRGAQRTPTASRSRLGLVFGGGRQRCPEGGMSAVAAARLPCRDNTATLQSTANASDQWMLPPPLRPELKPAKDEAPGPEEHTPLTSPMPPGRAAALVGGGSRRATRSKSPRKQTTETYVRWPRPR